MRNQLCGSWLWACVVITTAACSATPSSSVNGRTTALSDDTAATQSQVIGAGGPGATTDGPAAPSTSGVASVQQTTDPNLYYETRYPWALVGRFDLSNPNAPRFALPGTKVGVRFTGTSLAVQMVDFGVDTFDVLIDGNMYVAPANQFDELNAPAAPCQPATSVAAWDGNNFPGCLLLNKSSNTSSPTTYPIVTGLAPGEHTAWLIKRTEFLQQSAGITQLFGFVVDANAQILAAPPVRKRRIEVVGDSSTSGYGSAQPLPCAYSERNSDSYLAIPGYLAQYLNAEVVNISSAGQGVFHSFYDLTNNAIHKLPVLYRQRIPVETTPYDFTSDHVDAVILSAGGDDLWGAGGAGNFNNANPADTSDARTNFINAYADWLVDIRSKRPDATIFCTLSYAAFANDIVVLGSAVQAAVAQRNAAGDANVAYFAFFPTIDTAHNSARYTNLGDAAYALSLSYGCDGHPQPNMSRYLSGLLGPFVAQRMGWADAGVPSTRP